MSVTTPTTLYNYYTTPSITRGLSADTQNFTLNNQPITIYSGALHYFRVPSQYWRDRLRKLKAAGLNTVETYVPWNLHEETPGNFDFGSGGTDFESFLDIRRFLELAQEEDLFAIVRPGPYICSEWDFGGLPSWLLKDPELKIRRNDPKFLGHVKNYFGALFKILAMLQFTRGGPIIAFQIENEYGNVAVDNEPIDLPYLQKLVEIFKENDLVELLFTSDTPSNGKLGAIPGILYTANFQTDAQKELTILQSYQEGKPSMVMEFWSGWFDHWGEKHHKIPTQQFAKELEDILKFPASVNFYMFHGGTNWGFMNGANIMDDGSVAFDTSSYDYDAPLSECGDYTEKYHVVKDLIQKYDKIKISLPSMPKEMQKVVFPDISTSKMMRIQPYIDNQPHMKSSNIKPMEFVDQLYGYIAYSKILDIKAGAILSIQGLVKDTALVLLNGELVNPPFAKSSDLDGFSFWKCKNGSITLSNKDLQGAKLTILVENFGRVNYGKLHQFNQFRGLTDSVLIDNKEISDWEIIKLPFDKKHNNFFTSNDNAKLYEDIDCIYKGPGIYKFELLVDTEIQNTTTFLDMRGWNKGIVIVNGFVLSRYFKLGPQQTCYLPGAFLKQGKNDIIVFEHYQNAAKLSFSGKPIFETMAD